MGEKTPGIRNTNTTQTSPLKIPLLSKTPAEGKTEQAAFKGIKETVKELVSSARSLIGRICLAVGSAPKKISQFFARFFHQTETERPSTVEMRDSEAISTPEALNAEIEYNFSHLIDPETGKLEAYSKDDRKDVNLLFDLLKPKQGDSEELKQAKQDKMTALLDLPETESSPTKTTKTLQYPSDTKVNDGDPRKSPPKVENPSIERVVAHELKTADKAPLPSIAVREYIEDLVQNIRNNRTEDYLTSSENPAIDFSKIKTELKTAIDSKNNRSAAWTPDDFLEFEDACSQKTRSKGARLTAEDLALEREIPLQATELKLEEITDESGTRKMVWKGGDGSVDEEKTITFKLLSEEDIAVAKRSIDELFQLESVQEQFRNLFDELKSGT